MSKLQSQASESPPCQPKSLSRVLGKPLNHPHSSSRCLSTLVPRNSSTHAEIQTHPALTLGISPELTLLKHQTRLTEPVAFPPNPMFLVSGNGRTEHSPALLGNSKRDSLGPSSLPFLTGLEFTIQVSGGLAEGQPVQDQESLHTEACEGQSPPSPTPTPRPQPLAHPQDTSGLTL